MKLMTYQNPLRLLIPLPQLSGNTGERCFSAAGAPDFGKLILNTGEHRRVPAPSE